MKLEIKHLAAYLPYGITFKSEMDKPFDEVGFNPVWTAEGLIKMFGDYCLTTKDNNDAYAIQTCKLILRPLSQLTQEIEHNGKKFVPKDLLISWNIGIYNSDEGVNLYFDEVCYQDIQNLLEWHFDIFGLIEKKLAIEKL
jgi:hypothetical protein